MGGTTVAWTAEDREKQSGIHGQDYESIISILNGNGATITYNTI